MGYIYKITNSNNNKIYIGQTTRTIQERFKEHCHARDSTHLHLAMQKYGYGTFSITQVEQCADDELDKREQYWIQHYNSYQTGYNMNKGGGGGGDYFKSAQEYWKNHPDEFRELYTSSLNKMKKYWQEHPEEREIQIKNFSQAGQNYWKNHPKEAEQRNRKLMENGHAARSKQVLCVELNKIFPSVREAAKQMGLSHPNISKAARENRLSGGYHWKYV